MKIQFRIGTYDNLLTLTNYTENVDLQCFRVDFVQRNWHGEAVTKHRLLEVIKQIRAYRLLRIGQ